MFIVIFGQKNGSDFLSKIRVVILRQKYFGRD